MISISSWSKLIINLRDVQSLKMAFMNGNLVNNWSLGRDICEKHVEKRYGDGVINALSRDLRALIPEASGLTPVN